MHFNQIHAKWLQRLEEMSKKYGTAIQKSRPYYEALSEVSAFLALKNFLLFKRNYILCIAKWLGKHWITFVVF